MIDVKELRKDFPILKQTIYGKQLVYLDNGATTQKPLEVIESITKSYCEINSNVHRGVHHLSQLSTERAEETREITKNFINAKYSKEIVFTKGTTESFNLLAHSFCQTYCQKGDEIIISEMEHHANIVPWQLQKLIRGIVLKVIPVNKEGELEIDKINTLITSKTKLISIAHVSNVLGTINPIKEIIKIAKKKNIPVAIDAAQSIQHFSLDVQDIDCDFLAFSSHKIYGPTGVGVLYGKEKFLDEMVPYQGGGEMIKTVTLQESTFNEIPFKFEAGTPNYIDIIAFGEALKYIKKIGLENIKKHEDYLLHYCTSELSKIPNLTIFGTAKDKCSVISFLVKDIHYYDIGILLDKMGIAVRTGNHCAQPIMQRFGIEGTVRVAFAIYNTKEEIDIFIMALKKTLTILT